MRDDVTERRPQRREPDAARDDDDVAPDRLRDRPRVPERAAHAEQLLPASDPQIASETAPTARTVCTSRPPSSPRDRDRHLADAERVQHRELTRLAGERLAVDGLELDRPRVVRLAAAPQDPERPRCWAAGTASARTVIAVDVEEPEAGPLQALDQHLSEADMSS